MTLHDHCIEVWSSLPVDILGIGEGSCNYLVMVFVSLFLVLYFMETILSLVILLLLLRRSDSIFTQVGKLHLMMNGYTMEVLMS